MSLSPEAKRLVALQHAKYLSTLPDKKKRLDHCWNEIQRHGWTRELSTNLKTEVHRLAGSAGSYGLNSLGQTALDLDVLLTKDLDISSSESKPGAKFTELLHKLYQAMDKEIAEFSRSTD